MAGTGERMQNQPDNLWGDPIFSYTRAQAIADGVLVDLTTATDDKGQRLCPQAGFKVPVAITRTAWAQTIEAGGSWKPDGEGEVLELKGGQSLTGRLWDCALDAAGRIRQGRELRPGSLPSAGGCRRRWPS